MCGAVSATGGPAVDISGTSTNATGFNFDDVDSTGSANDGINLDDLGTGTFSATSGDIGGAAGIAFDLNGGSGNITYPGNLGNGSGQSAEITGRSGGAVMLSGNINDTNDGSGGIAMSGNTGGSTEFSGATKTLNTGASTAFSSTGSAHTINFTNGGLDSDTMIVVGTGANPNTIDSTTGTALNVSNTTIGSNGLTFRSISANGAANGIVLNSTGTSGGLTVAGDGGASNNGSGGTIQNTTGIGILINAATNVSLGYMNITNSGTDGLNVNNINGFTLNRSTIVDNTSTSQANHNGIRIGDFVSGTAVNGAISITNSSATFSSHDNLAVGIGSGTSTWNITGSTFSFSGGNGGGDGSADVAGNSGVNFEIRGAATVSNFTFTGNTLEGNYADGMQISPASNATGSLVATISNNTWRNNNIHLDLNADASADMTYKVLNNSMVNTTRNATGGIDGASQAVNIFQGSLSTSASLLSLRFVGNDIGDPNINGSGSSFGNGLRVNFNGNGQGHVLIDDNDIVEAPVGRGMEVIGRNGNGQLDVTVTNNRVDHTNIPFNPGTSEFTLAAIFVQSHETQVGSSTHYTVRSDVPGNTVPSGSAFDLSTGYITIAESQASGNSSNHQLVDNPAGPAGQTPAQQLAGANTGSTGVVGGASLIAGPINLPPS